MGLNITLTGEKCCRKEIVKYRYEDAKHRCEIPAVEIINGKHYCAQHATIRKRELKREEKRMFDKNKCSNKCHMAHGEVCHHKDCPSYSKTDYKLNE